MARASSPNGEAKERHMAGSEAGSEAAARPRVGYIGLGIMGAPMVRNLLRAGFEVVAWNRSAPRLDEAVADGALRGASPADVAARTDVVITCVTASADVEAVILGAGGVLEGVQPGATVIDMSTISPDVTRQLAGHLEARGATLLDAPVSGGEQGAVAGTLSIMVGGPVEALERVRPVLEALGRTITHCGPSGAGQTVKLCNQIAVVLNNLAMAEALVFCARSGVDPSVMLSAITQGAAGSWQLSNLGPRVVARDFAPGFKVALQQKDLRLALEAADALRLALPGTSLVHQLFAAVEAAHGGDIGTQALVRSLEALAGIEVGAPSALQSEA
ncbi:MAG: NAD(P)-dependent oxidoreductase [Dehalococcoidia bacterium]|nr:NAD(P)-dependent oxidoreductase [Dehalococcoidia bacterium]